MPPHSVGANRSRPYSRRRFPRGALSQTGKTMNKEPPAESGSRWALPIALLVLAVYFGLGIVSGGSARGWWF
jgi:hypothetical protein